jgi:hypothetical protein
MKTQGYKSEDSQTLKFYINGWMTLEWNSQTNAQGSVVQNSIGIMDLTEGDNVNIN